MATVLSEPDRQRLAALVGRMETGGETDDNIRTAIASFKEKYGQPDVSPEDKVKASREKLIAANEAYKKNPPAMENPSYTDEFIRGAAGYGLPGDPTDPSLRNAKGNPLVKLAGTYMRNGPGQVVEGVSDLGLHMGPLGDPRMDHPIKGGNKILTGAGVTATPFLPAAAVAAPAAFAASIPLGIAGGGAGYGGAKAMGADDETARFLGTLASIAAGSQGGRASSGVGKLLSATGEYIPTSPYTGTTWKLGKRAAIDLGQLMQRKGSLDVDLGQLFGGGAPPAAPPTTATAFTPGPGPAPQVVPYSMPARPQGPPIVPPSTGTPMVAAPGTPPPQRVPYAMPGPPAPPPPMPSPGPVRTGTSFYPQGAPPAPQPPVVQGFGMAPPAAAPPSTGGWSMPVPGATAAAPPPIAPEVFAAAQRVAQIPEAIPAEHFVRLLQELPAEARPLAMRMRSQFLEANPSLHGRTIRGVQDAAVKARVAAQLAKNNAPNPDYVPPPAVPPPAPVAAAPAAAEAAPVVVEAAPPPAKAAPAKTPPIVSPTGWYGRAQAAFAKHNIKPVLGDTYAATELIRGGMDADAAVAKILARRGITVAATEAAPAAAAPEPAPKAAAPPEPAKAEPAKAEPTKAAPEKTQAPGFKLTPAEAQELTQADLKSDGMDLYHDLRVKGIDHDAALAQTKLTLQWRNKMGQGTLVDMANRIAERERTGDWPEAK